VQSVARFIVCRIFWIFVIGIVCGICTLMGILPQISTLN
jgi:hypothetical protein